jgi:hypothetical protein
VTGEPPTQLSLRQRSSVVQTEFSLHFMPLLVVGSLRDKTLADGSERSFAMACASGIVLTSQIIGARIGVAAWQTPLDKNYTVVTRGSA